MTVRPLLLGRLFAAGVGLAYAWAAAVTVARVYSGPSFLRTFRWPIFAGEAAILAVLAIFAIAGATIHVATLSVASVAMLALMISRYDSESGLAPVVGIATALLAYIYIRGGLGSVRALSLVRRSALVLSVVFVILALFRMEEPINRIEWQRVRTRAGTIQLRTFGFQGTCAGYIAGGKDIDEIDSGCADVIPARRGAFVIAFSGAAAVLAVAGVAGAAPVRRLSDGMLVPTWT